MPPRPRPQQPRPARSPFRSVEPRAATLYAADDRVTHDRYGLGRIVRVQGERVDVRFGSLTVSLASDSPRLHSL